MPPSQSFIIPWVRAIERGLTPHRDQPCLRRNRSEPIAVGGARRTDIRARHDPSRRDRLRHDKCFPETPSASPPARLTSAPPHKGGETLRASAKPFGAG